MRGISLFEFGASDYPIVFQKMLMSLRLIRKRSVLDGRELT